MKLDILAIAAHPDDAEMTSSGTIIKHILQGKKAGILDLTPGELGTRGNAEIRAEESAAASKLMGIHARENLGLQDGLFEISKENKIRIIEVIRKYRPDVVLLNAIYDRHPDHGRASQLASDACFLSGLPKLITTHGGVEQEAWRPRAVYHYIQDKHIRPDIVVDITDVYDKRMEVVMCYKSQFYNPGSNEPETMISSKLFLEILKARVAEFGRMAGVDYGEGFTVERPPSVSSLFDLK